MEKSRTCKGEWYPNVYKFIWKVTFYLCAEIVTFIIQYSSTIYSDHEGSGFLVQKYHPKKPANIYFETSKQDWLGKAKPKDVFRSTINPSTKLQKFLLTE